MRGFGDSRLTTSTGCCIALKCGSHESKTLLLVVLLKPELALPRPRKETSDSPTPPVVQNANDPHPTALLPGFECPSPDTPRYNFQDNPIKYFPDDDTCIKQLNVISYVVKQESPQLERFLFSWSNKTSSTGLDKSF
uniref:Uncharacterized protein n=1 Tax=Vespula pensylvanica TaxID=30213 RepID=A0A834PGE6_VESPE|nr:hypothetical protein H0235_001558 [Vespula pensylvanica]